ncbi:MAG: ABC transporter ATP-binding protein [Oscillospiraceae bacterium]|nr:ABC transporter ATP-binding protein [Oscillospiraceae bacterium]
MAEYSKHMVHVPTYNILRKQDMDKPPVLDVRNLGIDFGGLTAVDSFNITIGPTEISGLIGPNGAGKTTIFNLLTSVYQPTRGSILLKGIDTKGMTTAKVNRMGIARTFQNIRLFGAMTAKENVKVGMHKDIKCSFISSLLRLPPYFKAEKAADKKAMELLEFMGLADVADVKAGSLPYGVQRRLEIARALATNPAILLLDEPAAGMNPSETAELTDTIRRIRDHFQIAIFLIEHDMNLVMNVCEAIAVVNYGKIIAKGTPEQIKSNPAVIEAYLGKQEDASNAEN